MFFHQNQRFSQLFSRMGVRKITKNITQGEWVGPISNFRQPYCTRLSLQLLRAHQAVDSALPCVDASFATACSQLSSNPLLPVPLPNPPSPTTHPPPKSDEVSRLDKFCLPLQKDPLSPKKECLTMVNYVADNDLQPARSLSLQSTQLQVRCAI